MFLLREYYRVSNDSLPTITVICFLRDAAKYLQLRVIQDHFCTAISPIFKLNVLGRTLPTSLFYIVLFDYFSAWELPPGDSHYTSFHHTE